MKPVAEAAASPASWRNLFDRPIFIVSTPRSGSTLLFETLEQAPDLYSIGGESHWVIEDIPGLHPAARGWSSNRLGAEDAAPDTAEKLAKSFHRQLSDRDGKRAEGTVRMLEKTPKNALRVPFLDAIWPDSIFIYLYRDVRETLFSMIQAWQSGAFRTYPQLPGWQGYPWSLLLIPGWQDLNRLPLTQIVARQWATTTEVLLADLEQLPKDRVRTLAYDQFLADPDATVERLARSLGLPWDRRLGSQLPLSKTTLTVPKRDKWRSAEAVIEPMIPAVAAADEKARAFALRRRG